VTQYPMAVILDTICQEETMKFIDPVPPPPLSSRNLTEEHLCTDKHSGKHLNCSPVEPSQPNGSGLGEFVAQMADVNPYL